MDAPNNHSGLGSDGISAACFSRWRPGLRSDGQSPREGGRSPRAPRSRAKRGNGFVQRGWSSRWILARSRTRGRGSGASATPQRRRRSLNTRGLGKPRPSKVRRFSGRRPWPEGCWHRLFGTDAGFSEYRVPGCRRKHLCGIPCRRMNGLADPWTHGRCPMGWRVCRIGLVGDKRALASADGKEGEGSRGGQKRMDQPSYRVNGWNASVSYSFRCRLGPRTYESTASAASCPEACPHARTR